MLPCGHKLPSSLAFDPSTHFLCLSLVLNPVHLATLRNTICVWMFEAFPAAQW